ncbi:MAG: hypothetical protein HOW73_25415 [Polyangiaceae bacterium]|nr:hypothetical protein [Polyangiaceae bacterium]
MQDDELDDIAECLDCGATISPGRDRGFALGDEKFLCFDCAALRGGIYDEMDDRWTVWPITGDEPATTRRPHV